MENIINYILSVVTSPVTNVVLTLLLIFQWFWGRAKEKAIKYNIFAIRRSINNEKKLDNKDILNFIDATLACLGSRVVFDRQLDSIMNWIKKKFREDKDSPLTE
ncbi:hypothetical protein L6259_02040 [Candidatus Parcubacteria bacterium]|nr:hypothetical protein [Candidatus Parcubacteria bacterium]